MSSTTPTSSRQVLILHEIHTDFISVFVRVEKDYPNMGAWLMREMRNGIEYCLINHVVIPDFRITTTQATQKDIDSLAVEEFLVRTELHRNS